MTNKNLDQLKKDEVKKENKKSIGKRIFDIVFWVVIIFLFFIWIFDFVQVKNNKEPRFCIKKHTYKYEDGNTKECIGLGYKVYNYNRKSINIKSEFGPFFIKMEK